MRDTVWLERQGLPSVALVTRPFAGIARSQARALGLPSVRVVAVEHPLDGLERPEVRMRAEAALPEVVAMLSESETG